MATNQIRYRGRNDDGNETTATWQAALNTAWTQIVDQNFRVRFQVQNDTSAVSNLDVQLQYQVNSTAGTWVNVGAASNVVRSSASANLADAANLTQQLGAGTGTFIGSTAFDEVNGICGGNSLDVLASGYFECEFSCQLRSADVVASDTIYLRTINSDTGLGWSTYTVTASMTPGIPAITKSFSADALGSYADGTSITGTGADENCRGFGATLGVGATDAILSALASHSSQRTWAIWVYRNGPGASNGGRIFSKRHTATSSQNVDFFNSNANSQYWFSIKWTTGGTWSVPFPATGAWHHFLITYDFGSTSNVPIIYMDGVAQTVTTQTAPTGSVVAVESTGYEIGSLVGVRNWDGMLAEFAVWDRILDATEAAGLGTASGGYDGKSPLYYSTGLVEYVALNDNPVTSKVLANPTVTGTAIQTGLAIDYRPPSAGPVDLIVVLGPDALGSYADEVAKEHRTLPGWNDSATTFLSGVTPISVNLPADSLGNYADTPPTILFTEAVSISDSLGLYADQAPTINEGLRVAPSTDALSLTDQAPTILFTGALSVALPADSLGLYADQPPTIREGLLITPAADSLPAYVDLSAGLFTLAARPTDDLNQWLDQRNIVLTGSAALSADLPADSLPAYADTSSGFITYAIRPTDDLNQWADQRTVSSGGILSVALADSLVQNDSVSGFFTLAVRPSDDLNQWADQRTVSTGTGSIQAQPSTDSLNNWLDGPSTLFGEFALPSADSMVLADQLAVSLSVTKSASLSDAFPSYADQIIAGTQKIAAFSDALGSYSDTLAAARRINVGRTDALANWADQVAGGATSLTRLGWHDSVVAITLPVRLGWQDSVTVFRSLGSQRVVQLTSAQPIPQDNISEGYGYRIGPVVYLVDGLGNYIVDENGNRIIASGLIDNLQQSDSVAITRTAAGTTPRLVALTDALPVYADTIQVSRGIVTLTISPSDDALGSYNDALIFVQLVGLLIFSASDALGSYSDSNPVFSTSGEKRVDLSDGLANYGDSTQVRQIGNLAGSLTDALANYGDSTQINTSGGLLIPLSDTIGTPIDSIQVERGGALSISLIEAQGGSFADARTLILGIRKAASDNLAAYTDSRTHGRGLLYSTPPDGLANYLDTVTRGGAGLLQAALSDNLAQYNDAPASFANIQAQPSTDDLAAYADSLFGLFALNYALFDEVVSAVRLRDFLDTRIGLFNELRYGLTDDLNQWADAMVYSRVFYAIRLGGNITERVTLTGKVIEEQIGINGKLEEQADLTGELYIGDP